MEESPKVLKAESGFPSTPRRPPTAGHGDRGLPPPRLPGSRERSPPGFFADSCQSGPQPVAQSPPHALPPTLAQTSGSGTAAASLCTADAQTPLTSGFPAAPGADCFRSAGPRRRGEAKHRVTMEMRSGRGEGLSDDNDFFEATLGLAPLFSG